MTESFVCPLCEMESFHPKDVQYGYCGNCHAFTGGAAAVELPEGRFGYVNLITFGRAQIVLGDETTATDRYTYEGVMEAIAAMVLWKALDCKGEPEGWIRHQPSNRRRTHGDPAKEYVRP